MKVLLSGASGLLGTALKSSFSSQGNDLRSLVRRQSDQTGSVYWDPYSGTLDADSINGSELVIHLSGANLATVWSDRNKDLFHSSRIDTTRFLCEKLTSLTAPPKTLIAASAIGFYGDRGDELINEDSSPGTGFLAELCRDWEEATSKATEHGIRVINIRIGLVLSPDGGALAKMLLPFQLGTGGAFGNGEQYMSWISIRDIVDAIHHIAETTNLTGPVNLVAPNPVSNRVFTKTLGKVLNRPTFMTVPAFALRTLMGQMAEEMLLSGQRVQPKKLLDSGFRFSHAELEPALRAVLDK